MKKEEHFISKAVDEARKSLKEGGIPVGAVLVKNNKIISVGHNQRVQKKSAILHAEIECIKNARRLKAEDYQKCTLYSTLSPCDMCSGMILLYKIPRIVIGENLSFKGPESYLKKRGVKIVNLDLKECKEMMRKFISGNKSLWREDIGERRGI